MGNWEAIKNDPSLDLTSKILRPEGKPPGPKELKTRALELLKILMKVVSRNDIVIRKVSSGSCLK